MSLSIDFSTVNQSLNDFKDLVVREAEENPVVAIAVAVFSLVVVTASAWGARQFYRYCRSVTSSKVEDVSQPILQPEKPSTHFEKAVDFARSLEVWQQIAVGIAAVGTVATVSLYATGKFSIDDVIEGVKDTYSKVSFNSIYNTTSNSTENVIGNNCSSTFDCIKAEASNRLGNAYNSVYAYIKG